MLRRSLIGSLRSNSPFAPPSLASDAGLRIDLRQAGRDTLASQKEARLLQVIPENGRSPAPQLDRSVDLFIVCSKPAATHPFDEVLDHDELDHDHRMFRLPVSVRRRIYGYCFEEEHRKISLSPRFATKAVFLAGYFASAWDVLDPVFGGIHAFQELRFELMTYFWTEYHFHITLNPFDGPKFSPLSHIWILGYLDIIQHLTVEVDLTRFGFSALKVASNYRQETHKLEELMINVVKGLVKRRGKHLMQEFNIMCRRYAGYRPYERADDVTFDFKPTPHCPEEAQYICDIYCDLRGLLRRSRISGFSLEYTEMLFSATFSDGDDQPDYDWAGGSPWPEALPPQTPYEKFVPTFNSPPIPMRKLELPSSPSSTFSQDLQDELRKFESSSPPKRSMLAQEVSFDDQLPPSESGTLAENVEKCAGCCAVSMAGSESTNCSSPPTRWSIDSKKNMLAVSPTLNTEKATQKTPSLDSKMVTPKTGDKVERMNKQNEHDPAYVRTVDALRSLSEDMTALRTPAKKPRPQSMIPSPQSRPQLAISGRAQTNPGARTKTEGAVRKYLGFVKRFRGRED